VQDPKWINPAPALSSLDSAKAAAAGVPRLSEERKTLYKKRSPEQLAEDACRLGDEVYDLTGRLRRERDAADKKLLTAENKLGWADIKIWILMGVVTGEGAILLWVLDKLWEQMTK
jgi:hypothetical protein